MSRRVAAWVAIGAALLFATACVPLSQPFEPPQVALEKVRVLRFAEGKADLLLGLRISNPNDYPLPVERIECEVTLDGRSAATSRSVRIERLPPRGDGVAELSGRVDVAAVATALMSIGSQLPVDYAVTGTIVLTDGTALPFAHKGRIQVGRFDRGVGQSPQ
jgi:LEA14-like dessication related protein